MIKNIAKGVAFLLIFTYLFINVSYALRPSQKGRSAWNLRTYNQLPRDTIDVVYLGGSSCFAFYLPMEAYAKYGYTSYNFATNTIPAQFMKYCIIEALKTQNPSLLIIDCRTFEFAELFRGDGQTTNMYFEGALRNFTDNFRYSINRFNMIQNGIPKEKGRLNYHLDIAKYRTNVRELLEVNHWKYAFNIPIDNTYRFGGTNFSPNHAVIEYTNNNDIMDELPLSDLLNDIYIELIEHCNKLDVQIIFIIAPYEESKEARRKYNYMGRVAEENGIPFLNSNKFFDEIELDPTRDYYDEEHVNILGAKKYTSWLSEYLTNMYDLPDRHDNEQYAYWQTMYELYIPLADETEQHLTETLLRYP